MSSISIMMIYRDYYMYHTLYQPQTQISAKGLKHLVSCLELIFYLQIQLFFTKGAEVKIEKVDMS